MTGRTHSDETAAALATGFIVCPMAARVLSLAFWLFGWSYLTAAFLNHELRLDATTGSPAWLDAAVPWLVYGVHFLVGPLALLSASTSLRVSGDELRLSRLFGLISRTYSHSQIRSTQYVQKRWDTPKVVIVFDDGRTVRFDSFATGFQQLSRHLWPPPVGADSQAT